MIEEDIENYLCESVKAAGGDTRKVEWVGRKHAPDRRVMHPKRCAWVECKAPKKSPRPGQLREHERMRAVGEDVVVVSTYEEVDAFMETLK